MLSIVFLREKSRKRIQTDIGKNLPTTLFLVRPTAAHTTRLVIRILKTLTSTCEFFAAQVIMEMVNSSYFPEKEEWNVTKNRATSGFDSPADSAFPSRLLHSLYYDP